MLPKELPTPAALAFLGDAVHSHYVRETLVRRGISHSKDLNAAALRYVTATAQERAYRAIAGDLSEEEADVYRRAFNSPHINRPKNISGETYRTATGFEAVLGLLDYLGEHDRLGDFLARSMIACESALQEG